VIDVHLVVQNQRVIAVAPVVADALAAIGDQRVEPQLSETGRSRQSGLSATDDQNVRIAILVRGSRLPHVEPVRSAEVA
jgi:hypothetical protein